MKKLTLPKPLGRISQTILIAVLLVGCATLAPSPTATPTDTPLPPTATSTPLPTATATPLPPTATPTLTVTPVPAVERVLIISIDGLRPDAIELAPMPTLTALMKGGAYTLNAQTIFPSVTLPAHTSMLTGLCPSQHGVTWNDYIPKKGYAKGTSIFALAKGAGLHTVMIVGKEKLRQVTPPDTTDVYQYINDRDVVIAAQAAPILEKGFGLAFIHFPTNDDMGHEHGWLSPEQLSVLRRTDEAIGTLLAALDQAGLRQGTLIIVSADHGGHDHGHGTRLPEDMTIPWIISGPGVLPQILDMPINTTDTAATAAWALKLPPIPEGVGIPVREAFGQDSGPRTNPRCP